MWSQVASASVHSSIQTSAHPTAARIGKSRRALPPPATARAPARAGREPPRSRRQTRQQRPPSPARESWPQMTPDRSPRRGVRTRRHLRGHRSRCRPNSHSQIARRPGRRHAAGCAPPPRRVARSSRRRAACTSARRCAAVGDRHGRQVRSQAPRGSRAMSPRARAHPQAIARGPLRACGGRAGQPPGSAPPPPRRRSRRRCIRCAQALRRRLPRARPRRPRPGPRSPRPGATRPVPHRPKPRRMPCGPHAGRRDRG